MTTTQETKVGVLGCDWLYLVVIGCKNRCKYTIYLCIGVIRCIYTQKYNL